MTIPVDERRRAVQTLAVVLLSLVALVAAPFALRWALTKRPKTPVDNGASGPSSEQLALHTPAVVPGNGYVTSAACQSCHARNCDTWQSSFHSTMTQPATPAIVRGEFAGTELVVAGRVYRLERRGDQFWAEFDDPDSSPQAPRRIERLISLVTGSHHMQIYWYVTGETRLLGMLPIHYLLDERKWVPKDATLLTPPHSTLTSDTGRWNSRCVACHTTDARIRPLAEGGFDTEVSQFGISCEACHGPGEDHVAFRKEQRSGADPIVNPARLPAGRSSQVCGVCHSFSSPKSHEEDRRELERGFSFRPGEVLEETRFLERLDDESRRHLKQFVDDPKAYLEQRFWPDGMVAVAGREYNGLVGSPCHRAGKLECVSCHVLHQKESDERSVDAWRNDQLGPGMEGDQACLQCHESAKFAGREHTRHANESAGSRCYNCHMPHTTYGLLGAIRSHQIDSPSLATAVKTGRPNACNLCHLDQTLEWTGERLAEWYGHEKIALTDDQRNVATGVLWTLTGDAQQRALAAWSMGWESARVAAGDVWMAPYLIHLLDDPYAAVRSIAGKSLRAQTRFADWEYDYIAPADERRSAAEGARRRWRDQLPLDRVNPATLLDAATGPREGEFERLRRMRNNRTVNLVE